MNFGAGRDPFRRGGGPRRGGGGPRRGGGGNRPLAQNRGIQVQPNEGLRENENGQGWRENVMENNRRGRGSFSANNNNSTRGRSGRPKRGYYLSYHKLEEYAEMEADDVILELVKSKDALLSLVRQPDLRSDWVKQLVKIFANMLKSTMERNVFDIIAILPGSLFIKVTLVSTIQELPIQSSRAPNANHERFMQDVLDICDRISESFPSSVSDLPIDNLMSVTSRLQIGNQDLILAKIGELINKREEIIAEQMDNLKLGKRKIAVNSHGKPPEDFRELSVVPTEQDIQPNKEAYLRPIKARGKYSDGEEYLDVQFRLLKEDFIAPLREGIDEVRQGVARAHRKQNVKVYTNVRIIAPNCTSGGITHKIIFDVTNLKHVPWQHSRRLIFGSIVCFSEDNFKTCIFATIANRNIEELVHGEVHVRFLQGLEEIADVTSKNVFQMIESPSYFEAYRHVLEALQGMKGDKLPFADYVVAASPIPSYPKYIRRRVAVESYDLSGCLTKRGVPCKTTLNNIESWQDQSTLNHSQLIAVKKALSREFTLIQGPPGTGKTYIGLRIAHALLSNQALWQGEIEPNILLVSYTNHALDQFIEGLLSLGHQDIVRVGSRCQSEVVAQFNLKNKKETSEVRQVSELNTITSAIRHATGEKYEHIDLLKELAESMEVLQRAHLSGRIVDLRALQGFLPEYLRIWFSELDRNAKQCGIPFLEMFLGLYPFLPGFARDANLISVNLQERLTPQRQNIGMNRPVANVIEAGGDEADVIDIQAEAEALVERWAVGQDEFTPLVSIKEENPQQKQEDENERCIFVDAEGFETVLPSKKERRAMAWRQMNIARAMTKEQVESIQDPMGLREGERWNLYMYLLEQYGNSCSNRLLPVAREYDECCKKIKELDERKDEIFIRQSKVIAMTTTCAARYRLVLQRIKPKIIIIEEAAEVLEAHVVTSLTEGAEHVILIGDHKQLKPKPSVYKLAKDYQLELSLFERMIRNGMDCHRLDIQHRMRPEIARLLQDIYPNLEDHPSVTQYPNVNGVSANLYFIDHQFLESTNAELKSKSNQHEAEYIVSLCWYLLLQGYAPHQITILTLYTGQLLLLKKLMPKKKFEGVRVTAVDNFQGEENDIILLSLVRSNEEGKVGFAGIENRVCVSLSRARHGLFVIGNMKLLEQQSKIWERILTRLNAANQTGPFLRIFCRNHPEKFIDTAKADDFNAAPEGGCNEQCTYRLNCGHVCQKACHPVDQEHLRVKCGKRCKKTLCTDEHRCQRFCHFGEDCGPCTVRVPKIVPQCNHEQQVPCSHDPAFFKCTFPVVKRLACGHSETVSCHLEDTSGVTCNVKCEDMLECGHPCDGKCNECHQGRLHKRCNHDCNRVLVCSHICKEPCSKECPPCKETCCNRCVHSKCQKICGVPCAQCIEKCQWSCMHKNCTKLCSEMCDREPCNEPCDKLLECHHPCIGFCGETCPSLCRFCNKEEVEDIFFGHEDEEDARFVALLDCNHIFEVQGLDQWMALEQEGTSTIVTKSCPRCKTPIRRNLRYGNAIKRMMQDVTKVKRLMVDQRLKVATGMSSRLQIALQSRQPASLRTARYSSAEKLSTGFPDLFKVLEERYRQIEYLETKDNLVTMNENQIECIERIVKLCFAKSKMGVADMKRIEALILDVAKLCVENNVTVQQMQDADLELKRLFLYKAVLDTVSMATGELGETIELLRSGKRISEEKIAEMHKENDCIRKKLSMTMMSKEEKQMVIKAMGFTAGHWYKCPNGHVYAIGDCGGANQESKCPECKEKIGGTGHRLAAGNAHAGEFDGSRHAAWSEAANLENFDPNDIF